MAVVDPLESLTVPEVAQILRLDVSRVYRLIREGRLPGYRIGRTVRVRRATLEAFVAAQEASTGRPTEAPGRLQHTI
ncbi:MAG TPA: helix-turn-helix domain-containing protein [Limnochordales bacterium]